MRLKRMLWRFMHAIPKVWDSPVRFLLWPFAVLYSVVVSLHCAFLRRFAVQESKVPVIVVGNVTVGGVGKTPLVIAIVEKLVAEGLRVGIVSRGYRATVTRFPYVVAPDDLATLVGDEPLLLAQKTKVPVVIAPRRCMAVEYLIKHHDCQIIVSDDGLQHESMGRALEIVVVDGLRGFGNGLCLPAGPLREPLSRLKHVDFIVINGADTLPTALDFSIPKTYRMDLVAQSITQLNSGKKFASESLLSPIAAIAAIGNPERFFISLRALGLVFKSYVFPDHHVFLPHELALSANTIIMTEKDAVKCMPVATDAMYALSVDAILESSFWDALLAHPGLNIKGLLQT